MTTIKTLEEPIATCRTAGVVNGGICGAIKCSSDECGSPDHVKCSYSTSYVKPAVFGEWIKCSDRLPEDQEKVLMVTQCGEIGIGWWLHTEYTRISFNKTSKAEHYWEKVFTHWQPLPPAPTGEG